MTGQVNFKPLGQMVEEHVAAEMKSPSSTEDCLKFLELKNTGKNIPAGNLYGTALGIIGRQNEEITAMNRRNAQLARMVIDFQRVGLQSVTHNELAEVEPMDIETHIEELRREVERLKAQLKR